MVKLQYTDENSIILCLVPNNAIGLSALWFSIIICYIVSTTILQYQLALMPTNDIFRCISLKPHQVIIISGVLSQN